MRLVLCISFPSRAISLQFAKFETLHTFCVTFLNNSTINLLKNFNELSEPEIENAQILLQNKLEKIGLLIEMVRR